MTDHRSHRSILYPKHFNTYALCPEKYFHERIERRRVTQLQSPSLVRGIAAHQILSNIANECEAFFKDYGVPAVPRDLVTLAERALPRGPYPDQTAWTRDLNALVEEVQYGVEYLDGEAQVLATEATYQYPFNGTATCPSFVLAAKVDAVLLRHDVVGRPYLDVVDWKGGTGTRQDAIQELACRVVVQRNAKGQFGIDPTFVQNTTVYLGAKLRRSVVITHEECRLRWQEIVSLASAILQGGDWSPNASPLCEWCPFFGNGCTLDDLARQEGDDASWLEGIAV